MHGVGALPAVVSGVPATVSGFLYRLITPVTVANTTVATNIVPAANGIGTNTVPGNSAQIGSTVRLKGTTVYSTPAGIGTPNATLYITVQGVTVASIAITGLLAGGATNLTATIDVTLTFHAVGAAAKLAVGGIALIQIQGMTFPAVLALSNLGVLSTVDSTADMPINVFFQWAVANAAASLTSVVATAEIVL